MNKLAKNAAELLKSARLKKGLTQSQVAELMGITLRAVQFFESGKENLTVDTIEKYCVAIGVDCKLVIKG